MASEYTGDVVSTAKPYTGEVIQQQAAQSGFTPSPAVAGAINFGAGLAGFPMDIAQGVYNAPKMAYGLAKGALGGTDLPEPVTGTPGTSESLKRAFQIASDLTGYKSLSPENPTPESKSGTLAYNLASKGAMVPGMALPALASETAERTLGPQYGAIGALAPSAALSAYNAARAPSLATQQAQNVTRDATLKAAREKDFVTPPSAVNPTVAGNIIEGIAGKSAMKQQAELINDKAATAVAREELGVPKNTQINERMLTNLRNDASEPYREVSKISKATAQASELLKDVRAEAKDYWRAWAHTDTPRPEDKRRAMALDTRAESLENFLDTQAKAAGKPELIPQMREARTYIAKTYDIERALNIGDGSVSAKVLGRLADSRAEGGMTGGLLTVAKFAEGPGKLYTRPASSVPPPGVSALNPLAAILLGEEGFRNFGSWGLLGAAAPYLRGAVRSGMLSKPGQAAFGTPSYDPAVLPQTPAQGIVQQGVLSNR